MSVPDVLLSLVASLALTLALESAFGWAWGVGKADFKVLLLANVLTNPIVVSGVMLAALAGGTAMMIATVALETGAVLAEGWIFSRKSGIGRPWLFAVFANLFSYCMGLLL